MWNFIFSSVGLACLKIIMTNCGRYQLMAEALWCGLSDCGRLGVLGIWNPFWFEGFQKDPLSLSGRTSYHIKVTGWLEHCLPSLNGWILDSDKLTQHNSKAAIQTAASSMLLLLDCSKVCREGWESSSFSFKCDYPISFFFLLPDSPFNLPTFHRTSLSLLPSLHLEQS